MADQIIIRGENPETTNIFEESPQIVNVIETNDVEVRIYEQGSESTNLTDENIFVNVYENEDVVVRIFEPGIRGATGVAGSGGSGSASIPDGTVSGSSQVIYSQISGVPANLFSSSQQVNFSQISGSFSTSSFLQNSFTASFNSFSSSIETKVQRLESATSSFELRGSGILSSSNGFFSSSAQVDYNSIQNQPTSILSASYALTASYISGSSSSSVSSSYAVSSSYSTFALSASYAPGSTFPSGLLSSSAQIANDISGSFTGISSSFSNRIYSLEQITGSFAIKTEISGAFVSISSSLSQRIGTFENKTLFSGSSQVSYSGLSNIPTGIISSSNGFVSGSDQLSGSYDLRYERKGTGIVSSSQQINNLVPNIVSSSIQINSGSFSGSFYGNGGNLTGIISSSYSLTSSYANGYVLNSQTSSMSVLSASYAPSISSSFASTASFATNIQTIGIRIKTDDTYITEGSKGYKHIGYNSNITKLRSIANIAGNININVKREGLLLGNYQLSNLSSSLDATLTNWTSSLNTNDMIEFYVSQSSTYITDITFFMDLQNR